MQNIYRALNPEKGRARIGPSLLYVPANKPELFQKALDSQARAIVLDLEDSVPANQKALALSNIKRLITQQVGKPVYVRVNNDPDLIETELLTIAQSEAAGVFLPKAELKIVHVLDSLLPESKQRILLIESARALRDVYELAKFADAFATGRADLIADLRLEESRIDYLIAALMPVVVASAAQGLAAPIAPAHLNVQNRDTREAMRFSQTFYDAGFRSQTAIHPWFCDIIHEQFVPSSANYAWAQETLKAFAMQDNIGVDSGGNFIDPAVLRRVQDIIECYER